MEHFGHLVGELAGSLGVEGAVFGFDADGFVGEGL